MAKQQTEVRLGVAMPASLAKELAKRARAADRSVSSVVRVLLTAALRQPPADRERPGGHGDRAAGDV